MTNKCLLDEAAPAHCAFLVCPLCYSTGIPAAREEANADHDEDDGKNDVPDQPEVGERVAFLALKHGGGIQVDRQQLAESQ